MRCRDATFLFSVLALPGAVAAVGACGAATGLVEDVGNDGGGRDVARGDAREPDERDSRADAVIADVAAEPACVETGSPGPPPSCALGGAGMTNCGTSSQSCCDSPAVTGASFYRTYTNWGDGATGDANAADISTFRLDTFEVTVGRFRQFANAWEGGWRPAPSSGKHAYLNDCRGVANSGSPGTYEPGWVSSDDGKVAPTSTNLICDPAAATWTPAVGPNENLPINCVLWYEAYAFCIWDGGFLPTEAEREFAAAGGSQQREYPWGTIPPGADFEYAIYGCYYPSGSGSCPGESIINIAPVGTAALGAGLWGQLDLAGELSEWSLDWYAPYVDPCVNCAYLTASLGRVARGGDFRNDSTGSLASFARPPGGDLSGRYVDVGIRCARAP